MTEACNKGCQCPSCRLERMTAERDALSAQVHALEDTLHTAQQALDIAERSWREAKADNERLSELCGEYLDAIEHAGAVGLGTGNIAKHMALDIVQERDALREACEAALKAMNLATTAMNYRDADRIGLNTAINQARAALAPQDGEP